MWLMEILCKRFNRSEICGIVTACHDGEMSKTSQNTIVKIFTIISRYIYIIEVELIGNFWKFKMNLFHSDMTL